MIQGALLALGFYEGVEVESGAGIVGHFDTRSGAGVRHAPRRPDVEERNNGGARTHVKTVELSQNSGGKPSTRPRTAFPRNE